MTQLPFLPTPNVDGSSSHTCGWTSHEEGCDIICYEAFIDLFRHPYVSDIAVTLRDQPFASVVHPPNMLPSLRAAPGRWSLRRESRRSHCGTRTAKQRRKLPVTLQLATMAFIILRSSIMLGLDVRISSSF